MGGKGVRVPDEELVWRSYRVDPNLTSKPRQGKWRDNSKLLRYSRPSITEVIEGLI